MPRVGRHWRAGFERGVRRVAASGVLDSHDRGVRRLSWSLTAPVAPVSLVRPSRPRAGYSPRSELRGCTEAPKVRVMCLRSRYGAASVPAGNGSTHLTPHVQAVTHHFRPRTLNRAGPNPGRDRTRRRPRGLAQRGGQGFESPQLHPTARPGASPGRSSTATPAPLIPPVPRQAAASSSTTPRASNQRPGEPLRRR
jgi:hypothetical protein